MKGTTPYKNKYNPTYKSKSFGGKVIETDGKRNVKLNSPELYRHFLENTCKVGDLITMYLTNKRPKRSESQNNYYFLYLGLISKSSGHTVDELHIWAKGKFLSKGIAEVFGDKTRVVDSTTDMKIGEFCEYLLRIEEETKIPLPKTEPFLKAITHKEYENLKESQKIAYMKMKAVIVMNS